ncbi:hypothetical protein F5Y17DRAFT_423819 [Xylariaceae sp. FL0594]|nr:hypothetical protein F5Y17DRAFT_423819 [Xylariaceae sp. FL0594]
MDQDSRNDESRERALSSEPSSTRPNPFDDDSSSRKRRRTSVSCSRSASVETCLSQDPFGGAPNVQDVDDDMRVDTPENNPPTTPARPEPTTEPVSSRVTLNLRNSGRVEEATPTSPTSPTSPTPLRSHVGNVLTSVEGSDEVSLVQTVDGMSSTSSALDSLEEAAISVGELEKSDSPEIGVRHEAAARPGLNAIVAKFPYRYEGEPPQESVARLTAYLRQHMGSVDDAVIAIESWAGSCLANALPEPWATITQLYRENHTFWNALPDLFYTLGQRLPFTKPREAKELIGRALVPFARLTAFLLGMDMQTLLQEGLTEENSAALMSPGYMRALASFKGLEDGYLSNGPDHNPKRLDSITVFQSTPGGSFDVLFSFIEHHSNALSQSPRKIAINLTSCGFLASSIVQDAAQRASFESDTDPATVDRLRANLVLGYKCFTLLSNALDLIIEKFTNNLSSEHATGLIGATSELLKYSLQGNSDEVTRFIQQFAQDRPQVPQQFVHEAIVTEWRLQVWCKLIRSRQMQLRVTGTTGMCEDLVVQWKRYQDFQQESAEDPHPYFSHLVYLSGFIASTGIVDYILGPTCHPEITVQSANIVGFLGVTRTFTNAQADLFWHTLTSTLDPHISDALIKMMGKIVFLFSPEDLAFILDKFQNQTASFYSPSVCDLFDAVTDALSKNSALPAAAFRVCVRLLRESCVFTQQGTIALPDVHHFAMNKLKRLLMAGLSEEVRVTLTLSCLEDIASKADTSSGSLQVLSMLAASQGAIQVLVEQHELIPLLVADLEAAVESAKAKGVASVYANQFCQARRKFLSSIMTQFGSCIGPDLGRRLWDHLVGDRAVSQDDRRAAWDDLNQALKRRRHDNQFLTDCLNLFLPALPPSCYCSGALAFVREMVVPAADDTHNMALDDEGDLHSVPIALLWQMILAAPDQALADSVISTLVNDIYVGSKAILSYPIERARKVHFQLVDRCLTQLKSAAGRLNALATGPTPSDGEPMDLVGVEEKRAEEQLRFARTLKVLTTLSSTVQSKWHFAAPDMRSLMSSSPNAIEGDSAGIKYQSFDGDDQSDVKPLKIGLKNSAASLLASLREATGFENYRLYYRGTTFAPSQADICNSLEDLNIRGGLILVKREPVLASSPVRIKPGASALEIEILRHFDELWEYLSMEEKLAREIYQFLVSLPADDSTLAAFESPSTSHQDVFPLGQPFKSLYAIHALREYLSTRKLKSSMMQNSTQEAETPDRLGSEQQDAVIRAVALLVAAICDPAVIDQCANRDLRLQLALELVDNFVRLLKETVEYESLARFLTPQLFGRLVSILGDGAQAETSEISIQLVHRSFEALLECCGKSDAFWDTFRSHDSLAELIQSLILEDDRSLIRHNIAKLITNDCFLDSSGLGASSIDLAEYLWPIVLSLLPRAVARPSNCGELFRLQEHLLKKLIDHNSNALDLKSCVLQTSRLLTSHTSTEDIAHPEAVDMVALGLISILHIGVRRILTGGSSDDIPTNLTKRLFSRHLFPAEDEAGPLVPQALLNEESREKLYDVIYMLALHNDGQMKTVLQSLYKLVELDQGEYKYELPQTFDRMSAVRSHCGYSGLRNLSNTCYLNSLFTQLYMNIGFRRFILKARVTNPRSQQLLLETQNLFANLQDSRRRFVDPQNCVEQITTYEELPIDIHNQMDVDEFYNLLFDRWEGQLTFEHEKKALRSIYGGQLVQQVKSQECEHISERIEPFSAIQCDIKGKSGLEDSLQAYVDGEILEGDNKYKCSTCDRHVNAVKRACLKDIPDNLIFHLKRFDFNLRLLQRSKINDYFPFPDKIDMHPYTVEHLSNPSGSQQKDMFELVGVLVHSGTAETGHYYSFIRERPNASTATSWVEFNDDHVSAWDPSHMENACFGGTDYRVHDGANVYEKVYSAYMLFYQRSSSLRQGQEMLKESGSSKQLRAELPPAIELQVKLDNWAVIQRHNLYGPPHMSFVGKIVEACWSTKCPTDSKQHKMENLTVRVALGHLDQVASRAKDSEDYDALSSQIYMACQRCSLCSYALTTYFHQFPEAFRMLVFRNIDSTVRSESANTYLIALKKVKMHHPAEYDRARLGGDAADEAEESGPTVMETAVAVFQHVWDVFHTRPAAWPEYFGALCDFAKFGRTECGALIQGGFLISVLLALTADQAFPGMPFQYQKLAAIVSRRMATRPPSYENMIALADTLLSAVDPDLERFVQPDADRLTMARDNKLLPFSVDEVRLLSRTYAPQETSVFADKVIQLNQNGAAVDRMLARLIRHNETFDHMVFGAICSCITNQLTGLPVAPYLRAGLSYCAATHHKQRAVMLIRHVTSMCRDIQNGEERAFFGFQRDLFREMRAACDGGNSEQEFLSQHMLNLPNWVPWLLGGANPAVSSAVEAHLRESLFSYRPVVPDGEDRNSQAAAVTAARQLATSILHYLRDRYVAREARAVSGTVERFVRVLQQCEPIIEDGGDAADDEFRQAYKELRSYVLEKLGNLTVDEIEEDGSGRWTNSPDEATCGL